MQTWVADPKAWPKSMPIMPPVSVLIMKLDRWRSPIPSSQWLMQSSAWELAKWERSERKASGVILIFTKARLNGTEKHMNQIETKRNVSACHSHLRGLYKKSSISFQKVNQFTELQFLCSAHVIVISVDLPSYPSSPYQDSFVLRSSSALFQSELRFIIIFPHNVNYIVI